MGILDSISDVGSATLSSVAAPFTGLFKSPVQPYGADFEDGFLIAEQGGAEIVVHLVGEWLPHQPFEWGGKQQLAKTYYPGNPEPTVQILGTRQSNVRIKGRFKVKHLDGDDNVALRKVPYDLCDLIDGIKDRGSLVKLTLGEWERWGFIEETKWMMKHLADIDYEIDFFIIGDESPSECHLADSGLSVPTDSNLSLIADAVNYEQYCLAPAEVNLDLAQQVNALVGAVAGSLKVVTTFIDTSIAVATNVQQLANRAIGLIKYAQAQISIYKREIGALDAYFGTNPLTTPTLKTWSEPHNAAQASYMAKVQTATSAPPGTPSPAQIAASKATVAAYTPVVSSQQSAAARQPSSVSLDKLLSTMLAQFTALAQTTAIARYLVKKGDTLQTIAQKFAPGSAGTDYTWAIYTHNKLTTTVLVPGTILEIPKK